MKRRQFIELIGGAAAWPVVARGQTAPQPLLGFISSGSRDLAALHLRAFHEGLALRGFAEGKNLRVEYRWAEEQTGQLSTLIADLIERRVGVITAVGSPSVVALQKATNSIPIVFYVGVDPVALGLVASLNRPGGNTTGIASISLELGPKRLEMLRELLPSATRVAFMVNPTNPSAEINTLKMREAALSFGLQLEVVHAGNDDELNAVFASLRQGRADAVIISGDPFYNNRSRELGDLTSRYALPSSFQTREFAAAGGLISYGSNTTDQYRLVGEYTGRVLQGERPADLPVQQATKVELIVNLKTAKALGLEIPPTLLARADEVIE